MLFYNPSLWKERHMAYLFKVDYVKEPRYQELTLGLPSRMKGLDFIIGSIIVLPPPITSLVVPSDVVQSAILQRRR